MKTQDQLAVRMYVRAREDFQAMRKRMDNRIGRKADGKEQILKFSKREFNAEDSGNFIEIANNAAEQEAKVEKRLRQALKRFPVYNDWLSKVKGVGDISAGWLLGEFDIEEATTVSKMWQYAGMNPGLVRGKKRVEVSKYKPEMGEIVGTFTNDKGKPEAFIVKTTEMVRGDKATPGFVLPYNKKLRAALIGVLATNGFIMSKSPYAMEYYYPYKARLEQEANGVNSIGNKDEGKAWSEVSKGHRDNAARRYMIKMFLKDFYVAWRLSAGLPVRPSYQEEYLGHESSKKTTPVRRAVKSEVILSL